MVILSDSFYKGNLCSNLVSLVCKKKKTPSQSPLWTSQISKLRKIVIIISDKPKKHLIFII